VTDQQCYKARRKPHRPHWYRMVLYDCMVCGGEVIRERVYGKRPKRLEDRWKDEPPVYCGCLDEQFL